jgi:hemerythrin-like domain-containing protein
MLQISKEVLMVATQMCLAHNMMVRNLNAIYLQCEQVSNPKDVTDFIVFCQTTLEEIHVHHSLEETFFFPLVAEYTGEKDIMEANVSQHHAFEEGLKKFEDYIYNATPETYNGNEVKRMVDSFGEILAVHLRDEIPTLLGLEKYGGDKLIVAWEKLNKKVLASIEDKVIRSLIMNRGNTDCCSTAYFHAALVEMMLHLKEGSTIFLTSHGLCHIWSNITMPENTGAAGGSVRLRSLGNHDRLRLRKMNEISARSLGDNITDIRRIIMYNTTLFQGETYSGI